MGVRIGEESDRARASPRDRWPITPGRLTMRKDTRRILVSVFVGLAAIAYGPRARAAEEAIDLFNGTDLSGWVNVNCAPETWSVRDGMIICNGSPYGILRTERMYQNYILEVEWRHTKPKGNAGLF